MERQSKHKGTGLMNYLSKAATFSVSNPPHSPGRWSDRGFSGPIVSIIPKEARHGKRSNSGHRGEPLSPKISCMGNIKPKRKKKESLPRERQKEKAIKKPEKRLCCSCFRDMFRRRISAGGAPEEEVQEKMEKKWVSSLAPMPSRLSKMTRYQSGRDALGDLDWTRNIEGNHDDTEKEAVCIPHSASTLLGRESMSSDPMASKPASGLGKLTQYRSGRETLRDFDWTKNMDENHSSDVPRSAPILEGGGSVALDPEAPKQAPALSKMTKYNSGRETLRDFDWTKTMEENHGDEEETVFIPHSAPIVLVGGEPVALEPKKEVNLWRRREKTPPIPLQIQKI